MAYYNYKPKYRDFGSRRVMAPARFTPALICRGGLFTGRHISTTSASRHGTAFHGLAANRGPAVLPTTTHDYGDHRRNRLT